MVQQQTTGGNMKNSKEQKMMKKLEKAVNAYKKFYQVKYECLQMQKKMTDEEWIDFCKKNDFHTDIFVLIGDLIA